ncbi:MAG: hypothetical protein OEL83_03280 [Desulforhopalus sp.]|nr:hypothetical protein [Desulforhopalus sp.]
MYYFSMLACLGCVVGALSLIKSLDLSDGLTAAIAIPVILLGVVGISWLSAKDSASETARNKAK